MDRRPLSWITPGREERNIQQRTTGSTGIRAMIVDDHPVVRYGLRHILDAEPDIEVVCELDNLDGIGTHVARVKPDVVLLDLELGDLHGIDALRRIRDEAPGTRVIIYTSHDEEERIIQAAELGVDGYLLKGCSKDEIVSAIRNVQQGGTALDSYVATKLLSHMNRRRARDENPALQFSKRETQVLQLLAAGNTNRDIGEALFISESTVKFHVHAILNKLGAGNRTEAVSIAAKHGIIRLATGP